MAASKFLLGSALGKTLRIQDSQNSLRYPYGLAVQAWKRSIYIGMGQKRKTSTTFRLSNMSHSFTRGRRYSGIVSSPLPDICIPENIPLPHYMINEFQKYGDSVALVNSVTGQEITYARLQTIVARVTNSLIKLGFGKGSVATLCAVNSPEFVILYLAIVSTGGVVSAVNPAYTAGELQKAVDQAQASTLIVSEETLPVARPCLTLCPTLKHAIVIGKAEGFRPFSNLLEGDLTSIPEGLEINSREDTVALPFSSGTTGLPKGVMLSHYNLVSNILQTREVMNYTTGHSVLLAVLPFFHIYGQVVVALAGLSAGTKIVTMPKFDPTQYLNSLQKYSATFLHIVPPIALFLAKHPMVSNYDFGSVDHMFIGAAPCGPETITGVQSRIGDRVILKQGYGLTEASPLTNCNLDQDNRYNTIGPATPNTHMMIVDIESRKPVEFGQTGELLIRGPQVMKGYFNNVKATAETLVDDWLLTGDIGYFEEGGHVVISDRMKELIKVKGSQVAPAELEALLVTHEAVVDAAVIGKPDERLGEAPTAFIVLNSKYAPSESMNKQLINFVAERVAPTKRLAGGIRFVDQIPKSASGKILRRELKSQVS